MASGRRERDARLAQVRERMAAQQLDALLVTHLPNLFYLTGLRGSAGAAIVDAARTTLVVDFRYRQAATTLGESGAGPSDLIVVPVDRSYDQTIRAQLIESVPARAGVEAEHLSVRRWTWLTEALGEHVNLVPTDGIVEAGRLIKDPTEVEVLRTAGQLLARTVTPALELVRAGRTEREIAADVDRLLSTAGFERPAFETIVASGPNSALPHARPGRRRLQEGDLLVLDFGGVYDGYCVDLTRTVCVGRRTAEAVRFHAAVLEAHAAALAMVRPGVAASDVDGEARRVLVTHGLAEAFGHGTGHGLGVEVHEAPRVARSDRDDDPPSVDLAAGMVFTIEPGVYVPEVGGVRIEDDILVTPDGCDVLTERSRALEVR